MYKSADYDYEQLSFVDFNESCGMQLDRDNEWILHASRLPWKAWEVAYAAMFTGTNGTVTQAIAGVLPAITQTGREKLSMPLCFLQRSETLRSPAEWFSVH